ncbi:MAG TPA: uroporphyrinogen decarboxylase family protein, partial [Holophaga sp.]|nr:uroporphyrinogen decarboxylase family protein [Holophaga sp.]
ALEPPRIEDSPALLRTLDLLSRLKEASRGEVPVFGVALAPFSLPVLQMGFEPYMRLLWEEPGLHARLMAVDCAFCVAWANAQLAAGADTIGLADPLASTSMVTAEQFRRLGLQATAGTRAGIHGAVATFLASASAIPAMEDLIRTGTSAVSIGPHEDLEEAKAVAGGRVAVLGNLDGISMRRWTDQEAEAQVKAAIRKAGRGGGWILSDGHGEIPWQVPESVLDAIAAAVDRWGRYPLDWVEAEVAR